MQIILEEDEIKAALVAYATSMITVKDDQEISIDMKAGRGENGYSATLNIQPKAQPVVTKTSIRGTKATPVVVEPAAPKTVVAKAGIFGKPTAVEAAPVTAEANVFVEGEAAEADAAPVVAGISTGEDRGDGSEIQANLDDVSQAEDPMPLLTDGQTAEAPADKPKSIFNFAKPAAAAGA